MSRQRPATYAIDRVRKFEYVALWCFTEQGCQAPGKDKASTKTSGTLPKLATLVSPCAPPHPTAPAQTH
jgi:hypothetical protein